MVWFIRRKFQFGNTARTVIFLQAAVIVYLCLYIFADKGEFSYRSTNSSLTPDETVVEAGTRWSSAGDTASLPGTVTTAGPEAAHRTQARPAQSIDTTRCKHFCLLRSDLESFLCSELLCLCFSSPRLSLSTPHRTVPTSHPKMLHVVHCMP